MSNDVLRGEAAGRRSPMVLADDMLAVSMLVALGIALVGWPGGSTDASLPAAPDDSSVDAGFACDMQTTPKRWRSKPPMPYSCA